MKLHYFKSSAVLAGLAVLTLAAQPGRAAQLQMKNGLTNADFFASGTWTGGSVPGVNDVFRADQNGTGSTAIIDFTTADAIAATLGATSWGIGTSATATDGNVEYPSVNLAGAATTSITQLNGDMTFFGPAQSAGRPFALAVNVYDITNPTGAGEAHGSYTIADGSLTIHTGMKLGTIGNQDSTATFNQNGGTVTLSPLHGTDRGYLIFAHVPGANAYWFGTSRYNLNAGIFQLENINFDSGGDVALNYGLGSTGVMYINTTNVTASDVEGFITAGSILLGDAAAGVSDFIINELGSGTYAGYTEVKLIPEPATGLLAGLAFLSLLRRRRAR